jgi:hypothetical protein
MEKRPILPETQLFGSKPFLNFPVRKIQAETAKQKTDESQPTHVHAHKYPLQQ